MNHDGWLYQIYLKQLQKKQLKSVLNGRRKILHDTDFYLKIYLFRYGRIQSVKIDDQRSAFVAFLDIRTALKAHQGENILDEQQLRTAFYDGSNLISKILRETSPETSSIIEPSSSSPSSITTTTNTLMDKTITTIHDDRDKRPTYSPDENTRWENFPKFESHF